MLLQLRGAGGGPLHHLRPPPPPAAATDIHTQARWCQTTTAPSGPGPNEKTHGLCESGTNCEPRRTGLRRRGRSDPAGFYSAAGRRKDDRRVEPESVTWFYSLNIKKAALKPDVTPTCPQLVRTEPPVAAGRSVPQLVQR